MSILAPFIAKGGQGTSMPTIKGYLHSAACCRVNCGMYRDLTHIFDFIAVKRPSKIGVLSSCFNYLVTRFDSLFESLRAFLSTHQILAPYRTSTHIYTEIPHIFFPTLKPLYCCTVGYLPMGYVNGAPNRSRATVLPPTFIPFFQSPTYRALNHRGTALLPTFLGTDTVTWPTKCMPNFLSSLKFSMCKVVFKIDLKKTTSVKMSFFINSSRKLLT
jgi:hypothetical protein